MVASHRIKFRLSSCSQFLENCQRGEMRRGGTGNQYFAVDQLSFGLAAVLPIESFNSTRSIDQFLLAGEERMAVGAYLKPDLGLCRPGLPGFTTRAVHGGVHIFWMNIGLHCSGYSCCKFSN